MPAPMKAMSSATPDWAANTNQTGAAEPRRSIAASARTTGRWATDTLTILAQRYNNVSQHLLGCDDPRTEEEPSEAPVGAPPSGRPASSSNHSSWPSKLALTPVSYTHLTLPTIYS